MILLFQDPNLSSAKKNNPEKKGEILGLHKGSDWKKSPPELLFLNNNPGFHGWDVGGLVVRSSMDLAMDLHRIFDGIWEGFFSPRKTGLRGFHRQSLGRQLRLLGEWTVEHMGKEELQGTKRFVWCLSSYQNATRWWQLKYFFMFTPSWGRWTHFDLRIFFKWVGSTTNQATFETSWLI